MTCPYHSVNSVIVVNYDGITVTYPNQYADILFPISIPCALCCQFCNPPTQEQTMELQINKQKITIKGKELNIKIDDVN